MYTTYFAHTSGAQLEAARGVRGFSSYLLRLNDEPNNPLLGAYYIRSFCAP